MAKPSFVRQDQYVSTPCLAISRAWASLSGQRFAPGDCSAFMMASSVWSNSEGYAIALLGTPKYELLAYDAAAMKQKTIARPMTIAFLIPSPFLGKKV